MSVPIEFSNVFLSVWEIQTGRCIKTIETGDIVRSVAWCPNAKISLIAVATGNRLLLINPKVGDKMLIKKTDDILTEAPKVDGIGKFITNHNLLTILIVLFIFQLQKVIVSKQQYSGTWLRVLNLKLASVWCLLTSNPSSR